MSDVSLRTRLLLAVLAASVTGLAIAGVLTYTVVTRAPHAFLTAVKMRSLSSTMT